jgi:hypothetical protein
MTTRTISLLIALLLFAPACRRAPPAVAASAEHSGSLPFGAVCTADDDCQSKVCSVGNSGAFCSLKCTRETQAADCPVPTTAGKCNRRGFCKRP